MSDGKALGDYLKTRRTKLDPAAFGIAVGRRRTSGLRREEVAQRANISATWYTWLEQGRGGRPSADVLDRIARALMLTEVEREHLFLIGLGRQPEVRYRGQDVITPRLQRLLDTLVDCPAVVRTATWDIVAWNRAAAAVLTDYAALVPEQRNILRMIFSYPQDRMAQSEWAAIARFVVNTFRIEAARAGAEAEVAKLVEDLSRSSPDFAAIWRENDVQAHVETTKRLHHPDVGWIEVEYSAFAVDGRPDLSLIVYNPATLADRELIQSLVAGRPATAAA